MPLAVTVGSLLLSGFLVAFVVTMSHESEEILLEREPSFAKVCLSDRCRSGKAKPRVVQFPFILHFLLLCSQ